MTVCDVVIQSAIRNGNLDQVSRLTAEKHSLEKLDVPSAADLHVHQFKDQQLYESVLGIYGQWHGPKSHPVVKL